MDVGIVGVLSTSIPDTASLRSRVASKKSTLYKDCANQGIDFVPFILDSYGGFDQAASSFIERLAPMWARCRDVKLSHARTQLFQRISFALKRGLAGQFAARLPDRNFPQRSSLR